MLLLVKTFQSNQWEEQKNNFLKSHQNLIDLYSSKKAVRKMPVKINGDDFTFSPGKHNQLQKLIIEEFAPRFAENSECLYVGDTIQKDLVKNEEKLRELGFEITLHDKMPDVVLYSEDKNWIYFIESVTSVGAMEPKRIKEIEEISKFFANETEEGKLYLSFPMIEAYSKPVGVNFKYRKENFEELLKNFSNFKSKIKKETRNRGNAYINSKYLEIIKFHIENSKKLLDLKIEEIERIKILEFENNLLKNNRKINVFSAIPIFLKEYFGMKKLNKILIEKSKKES